MFSGETKEVLKNDKRHEYRNNKQAVLPADKRPYIENCI